MRQSWPFWTLLAACSTPPAAGSDASSVPDAAPSASASAAAVAPPPTFAPVSAKGACVRTPDATHFASPRAASVGAPLRWVAVSEKPLEAALVLIAPDGKEVVRTTERHGGPPYWWFVEVPSPIAGTYRATLVGAREPLSCAESAVTAEPLAPERPPWSVWAVRAEWNRSTEDLYSAWIEKLFDDPLDKQPSWPALHDVLRDASRNFLHGHLGEHEDDAGAGALVIDPDCADLPFYLRAYFAHKLGLPFGYSACSRGGGGGPPRCFRWHSNLDPGQRSRKRDPGGAFGNFLRVTLANTVHSGSGRTPASDDNTDFYPVPLSQESMRPGTVYADPYGHMLVVSRRIAQTDASGGVLLAVDGQPDGTIARRRFWRGNFLFATDPLLGSPGFKRFRPVVQDGRALRQLANAEIQAHAEYKDFSLEQYALGLDGFYDKMDDVLSPSPLDPGLAMRETLQALEEQVRGRVLSVQNGVKYFAEGGSVIDMPEGPSIFETTGPWEDFSTPSRDLRLLIAIDIVRSFPERVTRRPERYAMPAGKTPKDVRAELEAILKSELDTRRVTYTKSDGSSSTLSLADVLSRATALEMAYNPNDCVEIRWGAPAGSPEAATCRRRAPGDQRAHMTKYRAWFHERRRPPRQ